MLNPVINTLAFPFPPRGEARGARLRRNPGLIWLTTSTAERVPALLVKRSKPRRSRRFLVLYSHGNAEDLTELPPMVSMMANWLDADVLAYEYVGYSIADGSPSEKGCYAAATAAYSWAVQPAADGGGGAAASDVVPFGRSLGSAAACYIAATAPTPVGALILQSPLLSGGARIHSHSATSKPAVPLHEPVR